ncbi:ABC transporter permease [Nitratireductor aquibiodomus]|uniref:ABC transporter permease n=1 Tax=Nitratireductor aquibiodomus TaxID=204799 RepID=UPI000AAF2623|nr:ABC transporter permease subunit [Nitratireductor aquibiodomus]
MALAFAAFFGGGVIPIILGLNLSFWPSFARMARAIALSTLKENHVEAARLAGYGGMTILRRHLLPPVLQQLSGLVALNIGVAIISISSLGFLGFGLQPPEPEWGAMISELIPYMAAAPIQLGGPCLAIFLTVSAMSALAGHFAQGTRLDA